jgi:O-antigen ligase
LSAGAVLAVLALPKLLDFARANNKLTIGDASALARLTSWFRGWQVFSDHPIIGIGINTWGFVQERYGWPRGTVSSYAIEGGLLFVAAMTGIVGLAFYVGMLWTIFARARRVWRDRAASSSHRGIAIGAAATIPAILVHSLFSNSLFLPYLMEPLWVLWGLAVVLGDASLRAATRAPATAEPARPRAPRLITLAPAR